MEKFEFPFVGKTFRAAYIHDETEAGRVISRLAEAYPKDSGCVLGLDIETVPKKGYKGHKYGGLVPSLSEIACVQIYCPNEEEVFLFHVNRYAYRLSRLQNFLETRKFIAHNAQFEISHLLHNRINPGSIGCSMLLFRFLLSAIYDSPGSIKTTLEQLIWAAFHETLPKEEQTSDWGQRQLTVEQKIYAVKDAVATQLGGLWCVDRMVEYDVADLMQVYSLNKFAQKAISQATLNGVILDTKFHDELIARWTKEEAQAKIELDAILPAGLNPRSTTQLSNWLRSELAKTPEGQEELDSWPVSEKSGHLACGADVLDEFSHLELVAPLQRHRKLNKLLTTYGQSLKNCINEETGRIHASYSQAHCATGRLSSFSPNIQQIPRGEMRKIIVAAPGWKLVGADFSMIEMRVVAHISQDEQMLGALEDGLDLYKFSASLLLRKPIDEVTKEERQLQKAILLGYAFGLGYKTLTKYARSTYGVEMTERESKEAIQALRNAYPTLRRWQVSTTEEASQTLMTKTVCGKIRRLPEDSYYCKALNTPVQGSAAEVLLNSAINIDQAIRENELDTELILLVHDELILHSPENEVSDSKFYLKNSMERGMLSVFPEATLKNLIDVKTGDTWADLK